MSSGIEFNLVLQPSGQGVLWTLWRLYTSKASGVLNIEWERFRKQIFFRSGEPVATKSNWPNESFGQFLVRKKRITLENLKNEMNAKETAQFSRPFGEWLVSRGQLQSSEMAELLEGHFRERLFNLLALNRGKADFKSLDSAHFSSMESVRLSEPFLSLLWQAARLLFTDSVCRSKVSTHLARPVRVRGDCPLPVSPQELKSWNGLGRDFKNVEHFSEQELKLLALATEFSLVEQGESSDQKFLKELEQLNQQFEKALPFEILNVEQGTTNDDVKRAYLELVKKYHPDRLAQDASAETRRLSELVFSKINEAHSQLMDPEKRKELDARMQLDKAGGLEKIQQKLEAEMKISEAKNAMRRRHYQVALDMYRMIEKELDQDAEVLADRAFSEAMILVDGKQALKDELRLKLQPLLKDLEKAISMKKNFALPHYYRGVLLRSCGSLEGALSDFERAEKLDPRLAEASSEARLLRMRKEKEKPKKGSGFFGKKS